MSNAYVTRDAFIVVDGSGTKGRESYLSSDSVGLQGSTISTDSGGAITIAPRSGTCYVTGTQGFTEIDGTNIRLLYDPLNQMTTSIASDGKVLHSLFGSAPNMTVTSDFIAGADFTANGDSFTTLTTVTGNWTGGRTDAYTLKLTKRGRLITCHIFGLASGASGNATLVADTAIAAAFRPAAAVRSSLTGTDNGSAAYLSAEMATNGILTVGVGAGLSAFAIGNSSIISSSMSWTV